MDKHGPQRRTVLKSTAVAALASIAGSSTGSAQETDVDHEQAAEMLREFYDGYLEGISHAVATEVQMEASAIEDGRDEPWPLAVWDDAEDARSRGITMGASEGGSQPFWDEYQSFDREFNGGSGGDEGSDGGIGIELLETNDPLDAGETLEVTAELDNSSGSDTSAELELVVGHDPTVVDMASTTVSDTETATLEFETAPVANSQTFPVRIEGVDDAAETSVDVIGTNETV